MRARCQITMGAPSSGKLMTRADLTPQRRSHTMNRPKPHSCSSVAGSSNPALLNTPLTSPPGSNTRNGQTTRGKPRRERTDPHDQHPPPPSPPLICQSGAVKICPIPSYPIPAHAYVPSTQSSVASSKANLTNSCGLH